MQTKDGKLTLNYKKGEYIMYYFHEAIYDILGEDVVYFEELSHDKQLHLALLYCEGSDGIENLLNESAYKLYRYLDSSKERKDIFLKDLEYSIINKCKDIIQIEMDEMYSSLQQEFKLGKK